MLDLTWKFFSQTGSIDTYLLFKELEKDSSDEITGFDEENSEADFPIT
ncbi:MULTISPECIES: YqzL family protein [Rossellomorea]|jgi:hypothetical protein|uniref:YqzL family protein n=1 Tax=Rossellomorea marisflavi TaxID=189381 RepID=A0A5D4S3T7_9BACI|nr:YqzL family protein [Rossellomorea marisflavi]MBV6683855.1 YqzL family protein [Bacillus sp. JRC01]VXB82633.1 conserved hypothetical protein [Bacillus sp. 349Y]MCM2589015.1 YqzL family protein [Rossellomorea marisflavi]MCM2606134.1 YqzL family protein [Rossellomorea marisflavi]MDR4936248.1 YqzL family protein [Rossellomorea marisflavi]